MLSQSIFESLKLRISPALACISFGEKYTGEEILKWMKVFYRRFFAQQFKRSCLPDGPKVGTVTLSPRGDWRMPSDASANVWLKETEQLGAALNITSS